MPWLLISCGIRFPAAMPAATIGAKNVGLWRTHHVSIDQKYVPEMLPLGQRGTRRTMLEIRQKNIGGDETHERLTVVLAPSAKKLAALVAYASQSFASPADADILLVVDV